MEKVQSKENHTAVTPLQHYIWLPLGMVMLITVVVYNIVALFQGNYTLGHAIILFLVILAIIPGMLARKYALQLQDRLIRTEETLRYYVLTNQPIDPRVTVEQLIALRFAPDEELVALVEKTINDNLSPDDIKAEIQNWRADNYRV